MLHLIAAVDKRGGIGKDNDLLCHISADLKRFKSLTMGHTMIMGRKTFESLPGVLPGRPHWDGNRRSLRRRRHLFPGLG